MVRVDRPLSGPKQYKRQRQKGTPKNMFPILLPPSFFSPLLCLKSSFSTFQLHLSNFTPSIFKLRRGKRNWAISLCLVKELTYKKSHSLWESNPNMWRTCLSDPDGYSLNLEEEKSSKNVLIILWQEGDSVWRHAGVTLCSSTILLGPMIYSVRHVSKAERLINYPII